jgi:hypothetical protein
VERSFLDRIDTSVVTVKTIVAGLIRGMSHIVQPMSEMTDKTPTDWNEKVSLIHEDTSARIYPKKVVHPNPTRFGIRANTADVDAANFPVNQNDQYILVVGTRTHWLRLDESQVDGPFYGLQFSV